MSGSSAAEAILEQAHEWYGEANGQLEQGDVLVDFPLQWMVDQDGEIVLASAARTVVVMTQSCDIPKPSQVDLLLADVFSIDEAVTRNQDLQNANSRKALARGQAVAEFLLPPSPGLLDDFSVVFFRRTYTVPKTYVEANRTGASLRLNSPYKEYLSQGYARFMMRVGLPHNLAGFK